MKIREAIIEYANEHVKLYGTNIDKNTSEIIYEINLKYNLNKSSIIPTDYCYNRINKGVSMDWPTVFVYKGKSKLQIVGEHYKYNGKIYWKSSKDKNEIVIGDCVEGKRTLQMEIE